MYVAGGNIVLSPKNNWPQDHLKELRGLLRLNNIEAFLKKEDNLWE